MISDDLFEIERCSWNAVLYPDGTMKRVSDVSRVIICKSKIRSTGYAKDCIIGPATKSARVQELLQQLEKGITKEDVTC
ncbi:MAG TPA: hypothetical protein VMZ29_05670 [Candidatus Bathyarchaeia archaeon]|nr:hypothetical protein [Candidatus Bathyarchaeia archaeon]